MSLHLILNKIFSCYTVQIYRIILKFLLHLSLNPHQKFGLTNLFPGATTANFTYGGQNDGSWNEPAQVEALSADTKVVTLSIGGNDIGFVDYVKACFGTCNELSPVYVAVMNGINSPALQINLTATYREILKRGAERKGIRDRLSLPWPRRAYLTVK